MSMEEDDMEHFQEILHRYGLIIILDSYMTT
nr:MAG TPA: Beta-eliminating lyase [Bacteriophage sp.]